MRSEVNLTINIEHDVSLRLDAQGIAKEVAMMTQQVLRLGHDPAVETDDRNVSAGPVKVRLRSAFIVKGGRT